MRGVNPRLEAAPQVEEDEQFNRTNNMATYTYDKCSMAVYAACSHCNALLEHNKLTKGEGPSVHVSKCPNGHGKLKSLPCCDQDMSCEL